MTENTINQDKIKLKKITSFEILFDLLNQNRHLEEMTWYILRELENAYLNRTKTFENKEIIEDLLNLRNYLPVDFEDIKNKVFTKVDFDPRAWNQQQ